MAEYDREKWVEVYQAVVLELKQSLMARRIADAAEIVKRIKALRAIPGLHEEERQAIEDALNTLQFLEREDVEITADEKRRRAAAALERLLEIDPKASVLKKKVDTAILVQGLPTRGLGRRDVRLAYREWPLFHATSRRG